MSSLKKLIHLVLLILVVCVVSCHSQIRINYPSPLGKRLPASAFFQLTATASWKERDSIALNEILSGNLPGFFKKFIPVIVSSKDSVSGKNLTATIFVSPDYLSIGTDDDWARIPLTPMTAQCIADSFNCFLPTRKLVDDIYKASTVKLEPIPMSLARDSSATMYQHHLMIEQQQRGRARLIAGIKKDVVISEKIAKDPRPSRVAIYGWHKLDGKVIQPLHTGHVNWYVDYSHGIRLVYRKIKVNGGWMDYTDVLQDPQLKRLLCDEADCNFFRYTY